MRKPVDVSSVGLDFHRLPRPERICAGPRGRLRCLQRDDAQRKGDSRALRRRRPANGKAANTISSETSGAPEKESFLSLAPPLSSAEATFARNLATRLAPFTGQATAPAVLHGLSESG